MAVLLGQGHGDDDPGDRDRNRSLAWRPPARQYSQRVRDIQRERRTERGRTRAREPLQCDSGSARVRHSAIVSHERCCRAVHCLGPAEQQNVGPRRNARAARRQRRVGRHVRGRGRRHIHRQPCDQVLRVLCVSDPRAGRVHVAEHHDDASRDRRAEHTGHRDSDQQLDQREPGVDGPTTSSRSRLKHRESPATCAQAFRSATSPATSLTAN